MLSVLYALPFDLRSILQSFSEALKGQSSCGQEQQFLSFSAWFPAYLLGVSYSIIYKYILHMSTVRIEQQAVSLAGDVSWSAYGKQGCETGNLPHPVFFYTGKKLMFQLLVLSSA